MTKDKSHKITIEIRETPHFKFKIPYVIDVNLTYGEKLDISMKDEANNIEYWGFKSLYELIENFDKDCAFYYPNKNGTEKECIEWSEKYLDPKDDPDKIFSITGHTKQDAIDLFLQWDKEAV